MYFLIKYNEKNTLHGIRMTYGTSVLFDTEKKVCNAFDSAVGCGEYKKVLMVRFDLDDPEKKCVMDIWQSMDVPMPEDSPFGEGDRFIDRCVCGSSPRVSDRCGASYSMCGIECPNCGRHIITESFKRAVNGWNKYANDARGKE